MIGHHLATRKPVLESGALGPKIRDAVRRCRGDMRDALGDVNSVVTQLLDLAGVVCEQPNGVQAQVAEDGSGTFVRTAVYLVSEVDVGVDGIETLVLKSVGLEFGQQPDTATFMTAHIDDYSVTFDADPLHGHGQLAPAVATL
jgi:hypothetical protein